MPWPTMNEEVDDEEEVDGPNCATTAAAAADVAISGGPTGTCPSRLRASIPIGWRGGSRVETLSPTARHRCSLVVAGGVIWYHASFVCSPAFSLGHGPTRPGVHFAGFLPISRGADYGSYGRG